MIVINFFGGPGAGKSTCASYVFSKLKMQGINTEFVPEFAKSVVWEKNACLLQNQVSLFAEQYQSLRRLDGQVDVAVMDSPLMLSIFYNSDTDISEGFNSLVWSCHNKYENFNFWVSERDEYDSQGRYQNIEEAGRVSDGLMLVLNKYNIPLIHIEPTECCLDTVVKEVVNASRRCGG